MKQRGGFWGLTRLGFSDGIRSKLFTLIDTGTAGDFQEALKTALEKHKINEITNKDGVHLLTYACTKGMLDIVKILSTYGADFNILDSDLTQQIPSSVLNPSDRALFPSFSFIYSSNKIPFLAAINTGKLDLVQYLVDNKVNILVSQYNIGPLAIALIKNSAIFDYLFEKYKEICKPIEFKNLLSESIKAACEVLDADRLQKLFDNGADLKGTASAFLPDSSVAEILFDKKHTAAEIADAKYVTNEGYEAATNYEIRDARRVLKEQGNTEEQISAILNILINNGLDVNYKAVGKFLDGKFLDQRNLLFKALSRKSSVRSGLERNDDGTYVNNFIAKILIDKGAKCQEFLQYIQREHPVIKQYYDEAQQKPVIPDLRLLSVQTAGKRTRRARARGRKTRRRKSRA